MNLTKSQTKGSSTKIGGAAGHPDATLVRQVAGRNGTGRIFGEMVTSLGGLEAEIMGLIWDLGRPVHSMEIAEEALYKRRGQDQEPIAFSTVATTLRRLSEKGLLTVGRKPADPETLSKRGLRTPYYEPTVGREEMAARILDNVSRTMLGRSLYALIPRLAGGQESGTGDIGEQESLDRLRRALEHLAASEAPNAE